MNPNPYLVMVEEYGDVLTESDLQAYKNERYQYHSNEVLRWEGLIFAALIGFIPIFFNYHESFPMGVYIYMIILGILILWFSFKVFKPFSSAIHNDNKMYLEAKRQLIRKR
jgi:uncharacterized membrane protein